MDPIDYQILDRLQRDARTTQVQIAEAVGLSQPSVADRIRKLDQSGAVLGYVARATHPRDGRSVVLTATVAGRRLVESIRGDLIDEKKRLLSEFPEEVRESAAELIQRLTTASRSRSVCAAPSKRLA